MSPRPLEEDYKGIQKHVFVEWSGLSKSQNVKSTNPGFPLYTVAFIYVDYQFADN